MRALNSQLLLSDTLQGREEQLKVKGYMKDIENKREQYYHEEKLVQIWCYTESNKETGIRRKKKERAWEKET